MSPTSSRNSVPPCASRKRPARSLAAPVKAPFTWPKVSLSIRSAGMAAQLTATKGRSARALLRCRARATSSLPVPVSPSTSTVASLSAARPMRLKTCRMASLPLTSSASSPSGSWFCAGFCAAQNQRSEEHTSELQSPCNLVCRLLLEKKKEAVHYDALLSLEQEAVRPYLSTF